MPVERFSKSNLETASPRELLESAILAYQQHNPKCVQWLRLGFAIAQPEGWQHIAPAWLRDYANKVAVAHAIGIMPVPVPNPDDSGQVYEVFYQGELVAEVKDHGKGFINAIRSMNAETKVAEKGERDVG